VAEVAALEKGASLATVGKVEVEQRIVVAVEDLDVIHPSDVTD
jgi:hypothetical protein